MKNILHRAVKRIESPDRWVQQRYAVDEDGGLVSESSEDARRWCMAGSILAECIQDSPSWGVAIGRYRRIKDFLVRKIGEVEHYNDRHTHKEVIDKMKEIIEGCDENS